jgi:hypothetical protein
MGELGAVYFLKRAFKEKIKKWRIFARMQKNTHTRNMRVILEIKGRCSFEIEAKIIFLEYHLCL